MPRTRIVALALLAAGCGGQPTPSASTPAARPTPAAVPSPQPKAVPTAPTAVAAPADAASGEAAVKALVAGIVGGSPDVSRLTPAFRKLLANGDDAKASWAAEQYLKGLAGGLSSGPPTVRPAGTGVVGVTPSAGDGRRAVFHAVKAGDQWLVDWLHVGPVGPTPDLAGDPAAWLAVAAFVEPALANRPRLAEAGLTAAGRAAVAPPLGADPLGFSRGLLTQKLTAFRGDATGYKLLTPPAGKGVVEGELFGPSGPGSGRKFRLTLADDGGRLRVAEFDPR